MFLSTYHLIYNRGSVLALLLIAVTMFTVVFWPFVLLIGWFDAPKKWNRRKKRTINKVLLFSILLITSVVVVMFIWGI